MANRPLKGDRMFIVGCSFTTKRLFTKGLIFMVISLRKLKNIFVKSCARFPDGEWLRFFRVCVLRYGTTSLKFTLHKRVPSNLLTYEKIIKRDDKARAPNGALCQSSRAVPNYAGGWAA
jgi:hypothetical protein